MLFFIPVETIRGVKVARHLNTLQPFTHLYIDAVHDNRPYTAEFRSGNLRRLATAPEAAEAINAVLNYRSSGAPNDAIPQEPNPSMNKRYCENCGAAVGPEAKFCGSCGKPVG